jgi:hypothetical protein
MSLAARLALSSLVLSQAVLVACTAATTDGPTDETASAVVTVHSGSMACPCHGKVVYVSRQSGLSCEDVCPDATPADAGSTTPSCGAIGSACCASPAAACASGGFCNGTTCQPTICGAGSSTPCCTTANDCAATQDCFHGYCAAPTVNLSLQSCEDATGAVTVINGFEQYYGTTGNTATQLASLVAEADAARGCVSTTAKPSCCLVIATSFYGTLGSAIDSIP